MESSKGRGCLLCNDRMIIYWAVFIFSVLPLKDEREKLAASMGSQLFQQKSKARKSYPILLWPLHLHLLSLLPQLTPQVTPDPWTQRHLSAKHLLSLHLQAPSADTVLAPKILSQMSFLCWGFPSPQVKISKASSHPFTFASFLHLLFTVPSLPFSLCHTKYFIFTYWLFLECIEGIFIIPLLHVQSLEPHLAHSRRSRNCLFDG